MPSLPGIFFTVAILMALDLNLIYLNLYLNLFPAPSPLLIGTLHSAVWILHAGHSFGYKNPFYLGVHNPPPPEAMSQGLMVALYSGRTESPSHLSYLCGSWGKHWRPSNFKLCFARGIGEFAMLNVFCCLGSMQWELALHHGIIKGSKTLKR